MSCDVLHPPHTTLPISPLPLCTPQPPPPQHTHILCLHTHSIEKPSPQSSQPNGTPSVSSPLPRHRLSFHEAMAPGLPFSLMSVLYALWVYCSPSDIIDKQPRIFYFTVGIVFSNIAVSCATVCSGQLVMPPVCSGQLVMPWVCSEQLVMPRSARGS